MHTPSSLSDSHSHTIDHQLGSIQRSVSKHLMQTLQRSDQEGVLLETAQELLDKSP